VLAVVAGEPLMCEVTGLVNGAAYAFRVRALNGAGWGSWSEPSAEVTPQAPPAPSMTIAGERGEVRGRPGVVVIGSTSHMDAGTVAQPWFRFPGQVGYTQGSAQVTVDTSGQFTWQRRTGKKVYVYFRFESITSNRVIIPAR